MNSSTRSDGASGFSLVELMIAISVLAILAAATLPVANMFKIRAKVAAGQQAASCLQAAFASFDPMSANAMDHFPMGIATTADLNQAAEALGCPIGPTSARPQAHQALVLGECGVWKKTHTWFPFGWNEDHTSCTSVQLDSAAKYDYDLKLVVPGTQNAISISSMQPMEVLAF
jgi:prepilin-type N-terminal cleavage/methylation domain-containing protein